MRSSFRGSASVPLLYQTEWCPASRRVRQRLTELELPYLAMPVPVERAERGALIVATGVDSIPALVAVDGTVLDGEEAILDYLDGHYPEPAGASAHRVKAEVVRRRQLEEATA
jgi:glutathione S-transferase